MPLQQQRKESNNKFLKGKKEEEVLQWGVPIEQVITEADASIQKLTPQIKEISSTAEATKKAGKRKAQLEFKQTQYVLQQIHENHERACQIQQGDCYNRSSDTSRCWTKPTVNNQKTLH